MSDYSVEDIIRAKRIVRNSGYTVELPKDEVEQARNIAMAAGYNVRKADEPAPAAKPAEAPAPAATPETKPAAAPHLKQILLRLRLLLRLLKQIQLRLLLRLAQKHLLLRLLLLLKNSQRRQHLIILWTLLLGIFNRIIYIKSFETPKIRVFSKFINII